MKFILLSIVLIWHYPIHGQSIDSLSSAITIDSILNQSTALWTAGDFESAMRLAKLAEEMSKSVFDENHSLHISSMHLLGNLYSSLNRLDTAEMQYLKTLKLKEGVAGKDQSYASTLVNLGVLYLNSGRYSEAESVLHEGKILQEQAGLGTSTEYLRTLNNLAILYMTIGDYAKAESHFLIIKEIQEVNFGLDSPEYARTLNNLSILYWTLGEFLEAEPFLRQAIEIRARVQGRSHSEYRQCVNNLAALYTDMGRYTDAEILLLELKEGYVLEANVSSESYAGVLTNLGKLYHQIGDYEKEEPTLIEAINIYKSTVGLNNVNCAAGITNLAICYETLGYYSQAEELYWQSLHIVEDLLGNRHLRYADNLNGIANLYFNTGLFEDALKLYSEVESIYLYAAGESYPSYLMVLGNRANTLFRLGRYSAAETLYLQALEKQLQEIGERHPLYANTLGNLGLIYSDMGLYSKARVLFEKSSVLLQDILGSDHSDYLIPISNLADLLVKLREYEEAMVLSIGIKEGYARIFGLSHPYYASALVRLGVICCETANYSEGELYFKEASKIFVETYGSQFPEYAYCLSNLANLNRDRGTYVIADSLYHEALNLLSSLMGSEHPAYLNVTGDQAMLYWLSDKGSLAISLLSTNSEAYRSIFTQNVFNFSEQEMLEYSNKFKSNLDVELSMAVATNDTSVLAELCIDNILFYRGFVLTSMCRMRKLGNQDSITAFMQKELRTLRSEIVAELIKPKNKRDSLRLAKCKERANTIEKEMMRLLPNSLHYEEVKWKEVRESLTDGEAAVEFVRFNFGNSKPSDKIMYCAIVIHPDRNIPMIVPLFEEEELRSILENKMMKEEQVIKDFYANKPDFAQKMWAKLEGALSNIKTIYYTPDGLLQNVNLFALMSLANENLSLNWVRLSSTRYVGRASLADSSFIGLNGASENTTAYIIGDIAYEMDSIAMVEANTGVSSSNVFDANINLGELSIKEFEGTTDLRGSHVDSWNALPYTKYEVKQVARLLEQAGYAIIVDTGYSASEDQLKRFFNDTTSSRVVHIATHGFAYPSPNGDMDNSYVIESIEEPMMRSGLILAGANYYWKNEICLSGFEDGLLMAYEIRDLNMEDTELVVLSACQTGLGDIMDNEGIYGLQRAFKIAGVKFQIVSLWQVPDKQTQELMSMFYTNWVEGKQSLRDAFANAQRSMRAKYENPYLWAGFVLIE